MDPHPLYWGVGERTVARGVGRVGVTCPKAYSLVRGLTLCTRSYGVFHSRQNAARASCSASRSAANTTLQDNTNSGQFG